MSNSPSHPPGGDEIDLRIRKMMAALGEDVPPSADDIFTFLADVRDALTAANTRISSLEAQAAASVEAEREACAKIAEASISVIETYPHGAGIDAGGLMVARHILDLIRARSGEAR